MSYYEAREILRKRRSEEKRHKASVAYSQALRLAAANGLKLRRKDRTHYQLIGKSGWLINVYPGNQRLYSDKSRPLAPYLGLGEWGLVEVVEAAIEKESS